MKKMLLLRIPVILLLVLLIWRFFHLPPVFNKTLRPLVYLEEKCEGKIPDRKCEVYIDGCTYRFCHETFRMFVGETIDGYLMREDTNFLYVGYSIENIGNPYILSDGRVYVFFHNSWHVFSCRSR